MKIYIIEDDLVIAKALSKSLGEGGYQCFIAEDFQNIMAEYEDIQPQLVLIDINLPSSFNGYYWCSQIRSHSQLPIIFISSADDRMNQMMAMQMGADDFISKPIDLQLTTLKVQALLRRSYDFTPAETHLLTYAGIELDMQRSSLSFQGQSIELTFTERQIISCLFKKAEQFVERERILDFCWQNNQFIDDNTLAVNISRIRRKLKTIHLDGLIETKKNAGYRVMKGEDYV